MRIHAKPQDNETVTVTATLTHCTITKVMSTKGKVQVVLETALTEAAQLEEVKALVELAAGVVDVTLTERPQTPAEN